MNSRTADALTQWSRGALEHLTQCPACKADVRGATVYERRDDALAMPDLWRTWRCEVCGSMFLNPRPDARSLPAAYADYYTHSSGSEDLSRDAPGLVPALINGYLAERFGIHRRHATPVGALLFRLLIPQRMKLDVYGRHIPRSMCHPGTRLMDVGCGNGAFLARAAEMGLQAEGCEPDPKAAKACRDAGFDVVAGDLFSPELDVHTFDIITMNHVIEHVVDPERVLARAYRLLRPDGLLWMAFPNPAAFGVKAFGRGWGGFHPPFHLVIPTQSVMRRWLERAGYKRICFVRRGLQSPGLWRESMRIAAREGSGRSLLTERFLRYLGHALSTVSTRWSEETIVMARKPA